MTNIPKSEIVDFTFRGDKFFRSCYWEDNSSGNIVSWKPFFSYSRDELNWFKTLTEAYMAEKQ